MKNEVIFGLGSLLIGSVGGFIIGKMFYAKKYQKQYEDDIKDMEEYYERVDEYRKIDIPLDGDEVNPETEEMSKEERREILRKNREEKRKKINYAGIYKVKNGEDGEQESPEIMESEEEKYNKEIEYAQEYNQKNRNQPPRIIKEESIGDLPTSYEEEILFYYTDDDILTNEEQNDILIPELFIGSCLDKYGFRTSDELHIYVQNFQHDKVYCVEKVFGNYSEMVEE